MGVSVAVLSTGPHTPASPVSFVTLVGTSQSGRQATTGELALLATVAHELRNPLASLRLSLDMLVNDFDELAPISAVRLIQRARRSAVWLQSLTENLTSTAAVETGNLQVDQRSVDLSECVEDAVLLVRGLLEQRGQTVRCTSSTDTTLVWGDRARIIQVLANLLTNASRYSIDGDEIELHVSATEHHIRVGVTDHGPGISPQDQQRIFGAWVRGESSTQGGLGLGLSIVQSIVQRLGGRVGVESQPGQGATFWFTVPLASQGDAAPCRS